MIFVGRINCFKKRHGICYRTVNREAAGIDMATVNTWKKAVVSIAKDFKPKGIFDAFFKVQPPKMLSVISEACHSKKYSRECLSMLLNWNSDGSKMMKPWATGKYGNPHCLKNISHLTCHYRNTVKRQCIEVGKIGTLVR